MCVCSLRYPARNAHAPTVICDLPRSTFVKFCKLCILIFIFMYSYFLCVLFCIFGLQRANWHSPTTLTEVSPCFFLGCKANARIYLAKTGHGPHCSKLVNCVVLCIVLCRLCFSVYCLCVNVYCTAVTGWQPNCS